MKRNRLMNALPKGGKGSVLSDDREDIGRVIDRLLADVAYEKRLLVYENI